MARKPDDADTTEVRDEEDADRPARSVFGRLARRLRDPRELGGDAMDLMGAILESSDKAKTEAVRMVGREVRHYLEELRLKDDLHQLITSHSLEVHMSLSLKPLAAPPKPPDEPSGEGA